MKDIVCEKWRWVTVRVVSFCNIDVTEVAEFGSYVSARTIVAVVGAEEGRYINMMTY